MMAFPDMIKTGTPNGCYKKYSPKDIEIKTTDVVKEKSEHGVSPHFRSGHFRLLSSDRFINKRGQIVFVKSSFVKGHAITVGVDND
jgi:hypothetical protein